MARVLRFRNEGGLEVAVERAAYGVSVTGRQRTTRKRFTTLQDIADDLRDEARDLARRPPADPKFDGGFNRRKKQQFTRSNPGVRVYTQSLAVGAVPRGPAGRSGIEVIALHPNADEVEYGNVDSGTAVGPMRIPITKRKYERMQAKRNLPLKKRRSLGWTSAQKPARNIYNAAYRARKTKKRIYEKTGGDPDLLTKGDRLRLKRVDRAQTNLKRLKSHAKPHSYPFERGGRYYMRVYKREPYGPYAILRQAMRIIDIRYFQ